MFFLWDTKREEIDQFILEANRHNPTIKFTAVLSEKETNFLDTTIVKKGERFYKETGTKIQSLTATHTLNRLRHFNTENRLSSPTGEENL